MNKLKEFKYQPRNTIHFFAFLKSRNRNNYPLSFMKLVLLVCSEVFGYILKMSPKVALFI